MELNKWWLVFALTLASCQWFDPTAVGTSFERQPHVYVNVAMPSDSTHCSLSMSKGLSDPSPLGGSMDACVRLQSIEGILGEGCGTGKSGAMGLWMPTSGLDNLSSGDTLALDVTTDAWDDLSAQTTVPHAPSWSGVSLDVRTYAEGDRVFDELEVALTRGANEDKWHLIQLMRQVDTVAAAPPKLRNLRSDDPHAVIRRHGDSMLDNGILLGSEGWEGAEYALRFRARNKLEEDVPYHYVVLVQSVSRELFEFWHDIEAVREGEAAVVRSNVEGATGCFGLTRTGSQLVFP